MTNTPKDEAEEPVEEAPQAENALGLSVSQIIAGGGAAAVASVIGGHLGLAGTVIGAFILSVISAVALPLFRASLERSHAQLKRVMPRRGSEPSRATPPQSGQRTPSTVRATSGKVAATRLPLSGSQPDVRDAPDKSPRARNARMAVGGTAVIFLVGLGSILGFQSATGLALSSGTSALQTGVSQVVSNSNDNKVTPPTKPAAPTAEPSTVPTDPATDPTEQPTPTFTSRPTVSGKPTAPASTNAPAPTSTPHPAVTSAGPVPTK